MRRFTRRLISCRRFFRVFTFSAPYAATIRSPPTRQDTLTLTLRLFTFDVIYAADVTLY